MILKPLTYVHVCVYMWQQKLVGPQDMLGTGIFMNHMEKCRWPKHCAAKNRGL